MRPVLTLVLALVMASCGGSDEMTPQSTSTAEALFVNIATVFDDAPDPALLQQHLETIVNFYGMEQLLSHFEDSFDSLGISEERREEAVYVAIVDLFDLLSSDYLVSPFTVMTEMAENIDSCGELTIEQGDLEQCIRGTASWVAVEQIQPTKEP